MTVMSLMVAIPGIGSKKADRMLSKLQIRPGCPIGRLTHRQREVLLRLICERHPEIARRWEIPWAA